jgi:hypothetical protein
MLATVESSDAVAEGSAMQVAQSESGTGSWAAAYLSKKRVEVDAGTVSIFISRVMSWAMEEKVSEGLFAAWRMKDWPIGASSPGLAAETAQTFGSILPSFPQAESRKLPPKQESKTSIALFCGGIIFNRSLISSIERSFPQRRIAPGSPWSVK